MLTPNLLFRVLPKRATSRSVYEELRTYDRESDIEAQNRLALEEENFEIQDNDLGQHTVPHDRDIRLTTESSDSLSHLRGYSKTANSQKGKQINNSIWMTQSPRSFQEDGDDDVPASLLVEDQEMASPNTLKNTSARLHKIFKRKRLQPERTYRASWMSPQAQGKIQTENVGKPSLNHQNFNLVIGNAKERALWEWVNTTNLDSFIRDVYDYYTGSGIWCILLEGTLNLVQVIFVAIFITFLSLCVNFPEIPGSKKLSDVLISQCTKKISGISNLAIWLFTFHVFWRVCQLIASVPRLLRVRNFYLHLLEIPESDMQTISWQDVVARIMALRDANPITAEEISPINRKFMGTQSKQRLDAHDIANRLMRRENYLIALFNKDILDLTLQVPFLRGRQLFSRTLLWNIDQCVMDLVFDSRGQVHQMILKESHRKRLSDALQRRFMFAGFMNAFLAPIIAIYLIIVYFLRYFNEYQKNPSAVGSRQYTPLALWKFREFNELQHLFEKRVNMSYPIASRYLDQFPKVKMTQIARLLAFFAGAVVSVLALVTLWDPEMLTNFEITTDRPIVFYIGVFGAIWALTNGMIPEENLVFEPECALRNVIEFIHYMPNHWQNRLHSDEVRTEFSRLYKLKIVIFIEEVFSIIVTPFILWFSLPKCSDMIVDFFREFTVHVDGVGYVCSFAVFDFKKGDGRKFQNKTLAVADIREDYYSTKHGKMTASYYGFIDNYLINPKSVVQGYIPSGIRQKYYPPPSFPGLMSSSLAPEIQLLPSETSSKNHQTHASKPRSTNNYVASPLQSILLDPHHQPSSLEFTRLNSYSRYRTQQNIIEEPTENESILGNRSQGKNSEARLYESALESEESHWEASPPRKTDVNETDEEDEDLTNAGVLGMLYEYQRAKKDSRTGVN